MVSAERAYVDPSALRSLYVHDDRSARFCAWRRRVGGSLSITRFGRSEIVNSVFLAVHRGVMERDAALAALADLDADLHEGRLTLVDVLWRRTLDLASELSVRHTASLGTRTLDVLHVATAMALSKSHFLSYDDRQAKLAKAVGLRVLAP
ncbi:MAG: PIN domain nuclease [Deltaproteobacteria bacterium]|nr:PIN domain nuclease [Deltaproteobacteria bacterium]